LKTSDDDVVRGSGENILKMHYCRRNYENCSGSACTDRETGRRRERQRMKKKRRESDLRRTVKSRSRRWKEGKNEEERVDGRYPKKIIRK
jgi:hypothetical protein